MSENPTTAMETGESRGQEIDIQTQNADEQCQDAGTTSDAPGGITKIVPSSDDVSLLA